MRKRVIRYVLNNKDRALIDEKFIGKINTQMDFLRRYEMGEARLVKVPLEDLTGEAMLAICENLPFYDPDRATKNGIHPTFLTYSKYVAKSSFYETQKLFALVQTTKKQRQSYKVFNFESFEDDDLEVTDEYGTFAPPGNEIPVGEQDNYNIKYSTSDDHERKDIVDILLSKLSSLERQVVRMSYGFIDDAPTSDKEIAALLNRTPDKIKDIRERALNRMRRLLKIR